jgi:calcineurin-like phosphoesterase family protein
MKTYLISDTHFKHENMKTYCDRPGNFTEMIIKNWCQIVKPEDLVIHLGDVAIGSLEHWRWIMDVLPGRKTLIRGNHDDQRSISWWMNNGFDFCCDSMIYRGQWLTHKPAANLPEGCVYNLHGHLHNIWHGFAPNAGEEEQATKLGHLKHAWQRLFAVEYTNYFPVEFDKFVSHPDKYQARGPIATKS